MKKKQTQKHAQKNLKKKQKANLRKKVNKQNRKIKKRAKAAKVVKSKKHNRRLSDHAPLILSPVIPEITATESHPIILPPNLDPKDTETLLSRQTPIKILGAGLFKSLSDHNFDLDMFLALVNLEELEKKLKKNQETLDELASIKIGQEQD